MPNSLIKLYNPDRISEGAVGMIRISMNHVVESWSKNRTDWSHMRDFAMKREIHRN